MKQNSGEKKQTGKKGFLTRALEAFDRKLAEKAKAAPCCCKNKECREP